MRRKSLISLVFKLLGISQVGIDSLFATADLRYSSYISFSWKIFALSFDIIDCVDWRSVCIRQYHVVQWNPWRQTIILMAHSHCTGKGTGTDTGNRDQKQWIQKIVQKCSHCSKNGKEPGSIVFYCAGPVPSICPGPSFRAEWTSRCREFWSLTSLLIKCQKLRTECLYKRSDLNRL